jgi:hypothetical protein
MPPVSRRTELSSEEIGAMDENWTIRPKKGFGLFEFGMPPEKAAALHGIYGEAELVRTNKVNSETLDQTMEQFAEFFSEYDLKAAKEELKKNQSPNSLRIEVYSNKGFSLEYDQNSLSAIQILPEANLTNFDGEYIFRKSSIEALRIFEARNGEQGRYRSTQALFANIAVSLDGFSSSEKERIEPMKSSDSRFSNRNIELRAVPYLPQDELDQFVLRSFL